LLSHLPQVGVFALVTTKLTGKARKILDGRTEKGANEQKMYRLDLN
jgi:hypothetical protein